MKKKTKRLCHKLVSYTVRAFDVLGLGHLSLGHLKCICCTRININYTVNLKLLTDISPRLLKEPMRATFCRYDAAIRWVSCFLLLWAWGIPDADAALQSSSAASLRRFQPFWNDTSPGNWRSCGRNGETANVDILFLVDSRQGRPLMIHHSDVIS